MIKKLMFILLFILPTYLMAGTSEGIVSTPLANQHAFMFSAGEHLNKPACSTQGLAKWAIALNTEAKRAMYSIVMTAYAQKKRLHVVGTGQCTDKSDRETVSYLYIVD